MKLLKRLVIIALVVIILSFAFKYFNDPYLTTVSGSDLAYTLDLDETLTYEQAKEDIDYLYKKLRRNHYSFVENDNDDIYNKYTEMITNLEETNTILDLYIETSKLISLLNDAHSKIGYKGENLLYLENNLEFNNDKIYVEIEDFMYEVYSINDIQTEDLVDSAKLVTSYENEYYFNYSFSQKLVNNINLMQMGVNHNNDYIEITYIDSGIAKTIQSDFIRKTSSSVDLVTYHIDTDNGIAYIKINQMILNEFLIDNISSFFLEVEQNNISKIVIDLADNGGGNSSVIQAFISYLDVDEYKRFGSYIKYPFYHQEFEPKIISNNKKSNLYDGEIYIVTSNKTFSAAMMFVTTFYDNFDVTIIGQPLGNAPISYGDGLLFQLPNSKLVLQTTYKKFIRPDETNLENTIYPDYYLDDFSYESIKSTIMEID
ncbi:S41 family peptidase [Candidatus Izemoplasma sp. B36]|uniref:S41 family peptidase n=1 Tax=Candidatus Izemoplasma sp. B36 TaxID=3242468 RepID=UPI0035574E79